MMSQVVFFSCNEKLAPYFQGYREPLFCLNIFCMYFHSLLLLNLDFRIRSKCPIRNISTNLAYIKSSLVFLRKYFMDIFYQISGASGPNEEHLMCVINKDMTDQKEVFGVEKAIRNVPFRFAIQYKPLIYTEYVYVSFSFFR